MKMSKTSRGTVIIFLVWLVFHAAHDAVWLAVGRFTDWNIQGTLAAILLVTLAMTFVTRWLGRFFQHRH